MLGRFMPERQVGTIWVTVGCVAAILSLQLMVEQPTARAVEPPAAPQIVQTVPKCGATDVDPQLDAIRVTFDQDMRGGMSWTGGGDSFPAAAEGRRARWIDKRTCELPVKLASASYYRVGVNSHSFHNFKSSVGVPAPPAVIYFVTRGADDQLEARVRPPKIVNIEPPDDAANVDPAFPELRVTFDMPMSEGMSWTGSGENFPKPVEGKKAYWTDEGRTCILPVELVPCRSYELGLNSSQHIGFQSKWGVPLEPVEYAFRTGEP